MVWGLFPDDPLSGQDKYYIFGKGTFKVGRKGCDVIITKDKRVSRIHAEILVGDMTFSTLVRVRDCSKYGTFITSATSGSKRKVHEFPNKETALENDGDLVSFGTGNAVYRFCFVPLVFLVYCSESVRVDQHFQEKVSSIGARVTSNESEECTHVLVDDRTPVKEDLIDAIVAKKPIVLRSWVELVAEKNIGIEIPSWSSYLPTLMVEGLSVKVADSGARAKCLQGYTCLMESINMYKFKKRLQSLLEVGGAKIVFIEEFCSNSQGLDHGQNSRIICVVPKGSPHKFNSFNKLGSLSRVNEVDLLCAVLSGHLDLSVLISPSVVVSSSCSTDETIVADSDAETETETSVHATANFCSEEASKYMNELENSVAHPHTKSEDIHVVSFINGGMTVKREKMDESESGNSDVIYSQDLIISNCNLPATISSTANNGVLNFKRFRKNNTQSGNSFNNLIAFSKYPYKDSDYEKEMVESVKAEKRRKQMEAIAEDLFNNEKGRRRGVAGTLHGLLTRG